MVMLGCGVVGGDVVCSGGVVVTVVVCGGL